MKLKHYKPNQNKPIGSDTMFTERDAIEFEMNELKEQARRDYDIYLTSRNMRNERYSQLMDRLREIDERPHRKEVVLKNKDITKEMWESVKNAPAMVLPQPKFKGNPQELRVDYVEEKKKYVPLEEVDSVVEGYLKERAEDVRIGEIKEYTEETLDQHWENFNAVMRKIMSVNPRIIKGRRKGFYKYDSI
jgi:hypothetical protein